VLEPASGDPLRLFFDITFFFIVIVILLAIMQGWEERGGREEREERRERGEIDCCLLKWDQAAAMSPLLSGLIIDGFGELRDKEEILTAMMQTKCFVCGLDKSNFDHIPHGFDSHVSREHSMSHYMWVCLPLSVLAPH